MAFLFRLPHQCCLGQTLAIGRRSFFRPLAVGPRLLAERVFLRISVFPPPVSACVSAPPRRHETDDMTPSKQENKAPVLATDLGDRGRRTRTGSSTIYFRLEVLFAFEHIFGSLRCCVGPAQTHSCFAKNIQPTKHCIVINQQNQSNEHEHNHK